MSSSSSSSSSSAFSFPALNVDDGKESYPTSLFASSQPNYRTIDALPSPSSSATSPFLDSKPLYRSTAAIAELDDAPEAWAHDSSSAFGHKELTLGHIRDAGELPSKTLDLPQIQVLPSAFSHKDLPTLPPVFEGQYSLAACHGCDAVMAALPGCLESYPSPVSYEAHGEKPRVSGVFYEAHAPVHFQVNVFLARDMGGAVIEVQRRAGDIRSFHAFFSHLQSQLTGAGVLQAERHQAPQPMESLSPPAFDDCDDDGLDALVQEVYTAKAMSLNHSHAREGMRGLMAVSPLPLSAVSPVMKKALASSHDAEQQRLAFALLQQSLECASPSGATHVQPVLPALFDCMGDLSPSYASVDAARSLARICDSLKGNPQLAALFAEHAEVVGQVKQMAAAGAVRA